MMALNGAQYARFIFCRRRLLKKPLSKPIHEIRNAKQKKSAPLQYNINVDHKAIVQCAAGNLGS